MASSSSPGRTLCTQWNRLRRLPGGKYLFSKLVGEYRCPPLASSERREYEIVATIHDEAGEEVARAVARWLVGPRE